MGVGRLGLVQIVIGGRNKYMINGVTAQPTRVQDLFHSVQLNVNNPHFLIMQVIHRWLSQPTHTRTAGLLSPSPHAARRAVGGCVTFR